MTVAELIEKLKELPQDYIVTAVTLDASGMYAGSYEVTKIFEYDEIIHEIELS